LVCRSSDERKNELKQSSCPVTAMRQQSMKAGGNREHSYEVKNETGKDGNGAYAGPYAQQTG